MVSIVAMVAQELNTGVNLIPADEVLGFGKGAGLKAGPTRCVPPGLAPIHSVMIPHMSHESDE